MSDADCTPGREPRSVAASWIVFRCVLGVPNRGAPTRCARPVTQDCLPCNDHAQPATPTSHRSVYDHAQTTPSQPQIRRPLPSPNSL